MKSKTPLLLFAFSLFLFVHQNHAQIKGKSKVFLQKQMQNISFQNTDINADNFFDKQAAKMGLRSSAEMQWTKTIEGENGYQHFRYQQVYQSIPILGSAYTIHQKNGIATHASGYYLPLIDLDINPKIDPAIAIDNAMHQMGAKIYTFEKKQSSLSLFQQNRPEAKLVIMDRAYPQSSESYALAYSVELSSSEPLDKRQYFIDANNGKVISHLPLLMHNAVPAQGVTKYYGTQSITVDSLSPNNFLLRDPTRNGNTTFNGDQEIWSNTSNNWDLTNEDQDEVAIDAHYCTQEFHDFMLEKLNWNGLNNEGLAMNIVVHAGDFVNAFWNGEFASFGDGDCNHGPLTTLEVVAHEFMHGITDYTSDLIYSSESGAINESMSDIFGKALEFYTTPNEFDWQLGASFIETPYAESFRSFEDPNSRDHPKFYKGELWEDGGGVHTNSSVGNHWFYQMVNGGSGMNEAGEAYNIEPLGMDKAIQIVFLTQKSYLTPNSTYPFFYETSIMAAKELYGENAPEVQSVMEAWKAVGLPHNPGGGDFLDLSISFADRFVDVCLNNQSFSTELTVTNNSSEDYVPSLDAVLTVSPEGEDNLFFPLTQAIPAGVSILFPLNDILFFNEDVNKTINATLDIYDEDFQNNTAFQFVDNSLYTDNDLNIFPPNFSETNCYNNKYTAQFFIVNNACNDLAAGSSFVVQLESPSLGFTWSTTQTLPNDLPRDNSFIFEEEIDLEPSEDYIVKIIFDEDVNLENNEKPVLFPIINPILDTYNNMMDFEDPNIGQIGFFAHDYLEVDGENVLAVSSSFDEFRRPLCLEIEDNIQNNRFGQAAIFFVCADLANMDNPSLGFDLTQYRNSEVIDFPELENNTTIFKASWTSENDHFEQIVSGQTEGDNVHYDLPLPAQFKGRIEFNFFHNIGDLYDENFLDYDVSLLDNLTIQDEVVNIKNINDLPIKIQPNPSTGFLSITHPERPQSLILRSVQGQILLSLNQADDMYQLDLSHLPDSYYLLTIGYGKIGQVTKGVVKMTR